jgi:hypothetical protein
MNTFGENVLGRSGTDMQNATRPVIPTRSNFPDAVDRLTEAPQYNPYQTSNQPTPQPKPTPAKPKTPMAHRVNKPLPSNAQYNDLVDNLHEVNSEMGQLLAKCVNVLERELFPNIDDDEEKAGEGETQEGQKQPSGAIREEASVIMALVGIKHVRDVLLGKQRELDLSVANQIAQMNINQSNNTETEEVPKPSNTADASATSDEVKEIVKGDIKEDTKQPSSAQPVVGPEPPATQQQPATPHSRPPSSKALNSTYVSPHPLPPKPNVSYNIEDLLSDTLKDGGSSTRANNKDKFSWMMESSPIPAAGKKLGSSSSLFSSAPGSSASRSAANAKRSGSRSPAISAVSVDPLDARHADRRKLYDE